MTTPRSVGANIVMSLDGFASADPSDGMGGMGWLLPHATSRSSRLSIAGVWADTDTVLLGRNNYEGFRGFWPSVQDDAAADPLDRDFSRFLDRVEKIVFSRTLTAVDWTNSRLADDLENEVRALKQAPGRGIHVMSSVSIIRALLDAELLDELWIDIVPAVLGRGARLFDDGRTPSTWDLVASTTHATTGTTGLHLRRRTG